MWNKTMKNKLEFAKDILISRGFKLPKGELTFEKKSNGKDNKFFCNFLGDELYERTTEN